MNGREPNRPAASGWGDHAAAIASLLREWALLREREGELLRRMAEHLEQSFRGPGEIEEARDRAVEAGATRGDLAGGPSASPGDDPTWIDQTIEAALAGAFSADPEPEETDLPAVDLLLLRSGDTWVGIPWDRITRLGLSDDAQLTPPGARLSLRAILGLAGAGDGSDGTAEPYCLTWETAAGPRALCCEVLGGVLAAAAAAAREVELVWLPDESEAGGGLLPLVEFFAAIGRDGRSEVEAPDRRVDDAILLSNSPQTVVIPASAEPPPTPVLPPPIPDLLPHPDPDPAGAPAMGAVPFAGGVPPVGAIMPDAVRAVDPRETGSSRRPEPARGDPADGARLTPGPPRGSRSALVSVRYLPARVAIARALRSHGWFVLEAADTEELPGMLQRLQHTVVFTEAPDRPDPAWTRELARAQEGGTRVIRVASRLRGTAGEPWQALGAIPHLLYPFQEAELDRLIESPLPSERG